MGRWYGSPGFATNGSPPLWRVSTPVGMLYRSKNLGVIDGTPTARHVLTQSEENADTKRKSGTNHRVASVAMRTLRTSACFVFEALIGALYRDPRPRPKSRT